MERIFQELVADQASKQRHVCVGLDTDIDKVEILENSGLQLLTKPGTGVDAVIAYNRMVIEQTADIAGAYKPNRAFYAKLGRDGMYALEQTVQLVKDINPQALIILDAKYGDIDSTNEGYVYEAYNLIGADAVTLHNYMGRVAMAPFLNRKDNGNFVLVRTSNKGGNEFQDVKLERPFEVSMVARLLANTQDPALLYKYIAYQIATEWNYNNNCGVVAGGTYPQESEVIRELVGSNLPILIPGIGAQGGSTAEIVPLALRRNQLGFINSSRGIIFAARQEGESQPQAIRRETLKLHQEIVLAQAA